RLLRVALVRPDDARGAALDPAHRVLARAALDASALVRDDAALVVEGNVREAGAAIADRAKHEAAVELFRDVRGTRADRAVLGLHELVVDEADPLHAPASEDLD